MEPPYATGVALEKDKKKKKSHLEENCMELFDSQRFKGCRVEDLQFTSLDDTQTRWVMADNSGLLPV